MNKHKKVASRNPWTWIPTLYFAEGLPYVAGDDRLGNHVQTFWPFQHRYCTLHELAIPPMGYKTLLESVCGYFENKTMVDCFNAIVDWSWPGGGSIYLTNTVLPSSIPCIFLDDGIQFSNTRHCRRRLLYVGSRRFATVLFRGYTQYLLSVSFYNRTRIFNYSSRIFRKNDR